MFQARPATNPLMLIYIIDKDSTATSSRRQDLFSSEDEKQHVAAISIALPKANISQLERDREKQMFTWWNVPLFPAKSAACCACA